MGRVKVISAGASYFETIEVEDAAGNVRTQPDGTTPIRVDVRREASFGDIIELSDSEEARLRALEVVGDVDYVSPDSRVPTPFSTPAPVTDEETGETVQAVAPTVHNSVGLTPEEAADLERRAAGGGEPFEIDEADEDQLREWVNKTSVDDIVGYLKAEGDGSIDEGDATRVLEIEQDRDKPRSSLIEPLEKVVEEAGDE